MTGGWGEWLYDGVEEQRPLRHDRVVPVKVVILAGGLNSRLTSEIIQEHKAAQEDKSFQEEREEKSSAEHLKLLTRAAPNQTICSALIQLYGSSVAEHLVSMVGSVERLCPVDQHCYLVVPEADLTRHLQATQGLLSPSQLLGVPSQTQAPLSQLQAALEHWHIASTVLAFTADLIFFPDYNFQRIIEHSVTRNKDVCGYVKLIKGKHVLEKKTVRLPKLELEALHHVSKVNKIMESPPLSCGSDLMPMPIFLLRESSLPAIKEYVSAGSNLGEDSMVNFLTHLAAKTDLHAIDLQFGAFRTSSLDHLKYTEAFFNFYPAQKDFYPPLNQSKDATSSLNFRHEGEETSNHAGGAPLSTGSTTKCSGTPQRLVDKIEAFVDAYFGERDNPFAGQTRNDHKLPSTFYMTSYRRQVAHADTGRQYQDTI